MVIFGTKFFNSTQPSITVISPNGGETLKYQQPYNITWNATNLPLPAGDYIRIVLHDNTGAGMVLADHLSSAINSYSWTPSADILSSNTMSGKQIKVSIEFSGLGASVPGQSANYFTIVKDPNQPSITVTSPTQAELWKIGETHTIAWNPGLVYDVGCHNYIALEDGNGKTVGIISNGLLSKDQTSFAWDTKDMYSLSCGTSAQPVTVTPGTYRIRVSEEGNGGGTMPDVNAYSHWFMILTP